MKRDLNRRTFLKAGSTLAATTYLGAATAGAAAAASDAISLPPSRGEHRGRIFKSIKFQMFRGAGTILEKMQLLADMGYDGVEMNSPGGENKKEALTATRTLGFPIHGVVDTIHWGTRLSDPREEVREKALEGLLTAIRESHLIGGTSVLLVPGVAGNPENENHDQVWERSIAGIRKALPLAARLGIHILIENVWNKFLYDHSGPADQTAEKLRDYIDAIDSPWVGVYYDIGNHQKYGQPAEWIRTLGHRIVKLDVKDWGVKSGWAKIGEGDVDWPAVRKALADIRFTGWATAEVGGGGRERIQEIAERMDRALGL